MNVFPMPYPSNLHFSCPIHEWRFFCGCRKSHVRDAGPIIFKRVRDYKRSSGRYKVCSSVVVIVVVMGDEEMGRLLLESLANPLNHQLALMRRSVDGHHRGSEVGDEGGIPGSIAEHQVIEVGQFRQRMRDDEVW